jgi:hypothetical protein
MKTLLRLHLPITGVGLMREGANQLISSCLEGVNLEAIFLSRFEKIIKIL